MRNGDSDGVNRLIQDNNPGSPRLMILDARMKSMESWRIKTTLEMISNRIQQRKLYWLAGALSLKFFVAITLIMAELFIEDSAVFRTLATLFELCLFTLNVWTYMAVSNVITKEPERVALTLLAYASFYTLMAARHIHIGAYTINIPFIFLVAKVFHVLFCILNLSMVLHLKVQMGYHHCFMHNAHRAISLFGWAFLGLDTKWFIICTCVAFMVQLLLLIKSTTSWQDGSKQLRQIPSFLKYLKYYVYGQDRLATFLTSLEYQAPLSDTELLSIGHT